jgi:hypothetical protein
MAISIAIGVRRVKTFMSLLLVTERGEPGVADLPVNLIGPAELFGRRLERVL